MDQQKHDDSVHTEQSCATNNKKKGRYPAVQNRCNIVHHVIGVLGLGVQQAGNTHGPQRKGECDGEMVPPQVRREQALTQRRPPVHDVLGRDVHRPLERGREKIRGRMRCPQQQQLELGPGSKFDGSREDDGDVMWRFRQGRW